MAEIQRVLRRQHKIRQGLPDDFQIRNQADFLQTTRETTQVLTYLLAGIAAVSLLVGGIGIMNIMLVSVTERTREIGIRKALGATRANILLQFLIEAVVLCLLGGIIGIAFGAGGATVMSQAAGWSTPGVAERDHHGVRVLGVRRRVVRRVAGATSGGPRSDRRPAVRVATSTVHALTARPDSASGRVSFVGRRGERWRAARDMHPALRSALAAPRPRALRTLDTIYLSLYRNQQLDISNLRGGRMWEPFVFRVDTGHVANASPLGMGCLRGLGAGGGPAETLEGPYRPVCSNRATSST